MNKIRAHRLFSELRDDLAALTPKFPDKVLCPLCLGEFSEEALDLEVPELTEEHVIPEELGGRIVTLTCKRCNNEHGSKIDAHVVQMLRARDTMEGIGCRPFRGSIEVQGIRAPSDVEWKVGTGEPTTFRLRKFNPKAHAAIRAAMMDGTARTLNVSLRFDYISGRERTGLLRSAYLTMFREIGYQYILSRAASVMRDIINSFEEQCPALQEIVGEMNSEFPFSEPFQMLSIDGGIAVMVVMTFVTETKRRYAVFMPSPELASESVLPTLCEAAKSFARQEQNKTHAT